LRQLAASRRESREVWFAKHRVAVVATIAAALVGLVVALGLGYNLTVATFVVVVYTAVLSGILVLGWRPFEALPTLEVGLWLKGELSITTRGLPTGPAHRLTSTPVSATP
jgi:hypothetical protein